MRDHFGEEDGTRASEILRLRELVDQLAGLRPVLESHLEGYDELIPHLLMSEIVDWVAEHRLDAPGTALALLTWMNHWYRHGTGLVQNMIAVSGVEAIPNPGRPGAELRQLLSPELAAVDPWNPVSRAWARRT